MVAEISMALTVDKVGGYLAYSSSVIPLQAR